ncbi:NADPH-dependent F420 reductase [Cereibacter sphaeroides]|uniref:NADPH-dependent F420 reductase n=1 Tax=Cereibacter sphaeroides TaxID=1063 RepID=UPI000E5B8952|nr:F420-dependent NADP oxidoreductase [Cereibacter sphaeroides]RHZ92850.1 F420-dependent NADP oxidoreductase [Cereibacter sphaeroides]
MKLAIIGNGNVGKGLTAALARAGHEAKSYGRGDDLAAAVSGAEAVILSTPFAAAEEIARAADFTGKVVIDVSNPVTADFSGLQVGHTTSAAETIAALLPGAKVVKAFNTVFAQHYAGGLTIDGTPIQTFVATDDDAARQTVMQLASDIGLAPVAAGPLKNARSLEPLGFMNIQFGYMLGLGTGIAPKWQIA